MTSKNPPEKSRARGRTPEKKKYVAFDLEATGLYPWYGNRVTCICAKDSEGEVFQLVDEDELKLIHAFLDWLERRSPDAYLLVTKNGKMFDVPFIMARLSLAQKGHAEPGHFLLDYEHFDLHELTEKWVSLNDMARLLKCKLKTGEGMHAIRLWNERRFEELQSYCMHDVITTEEVFLKWLRL